MKAFESLGFAFREQSENDFGIDAHAESIESEQPTGRLLGVQLKSGASYLDEEDGDGYVYRADQQHIEYWLTHALPVLICLCDVEAEKIYWQVINMETVVSTGKAFKVRVPKSQVVDSASVGTFRSLLTPVVSADRYTIFKTDDVSHATAKRYSFEAVLNGTASKAEVAAIVRQVTSSGIKRRYYRSHLVEGRFGDTDADVVWTFIYPSAEDQAHRNHICRSMWIRDDLDAKFRPLSFAGQNVGDNIIVEWSPNYDFLAAHVSTNTLSKEDYLSKIGPLLDELKMALTSVEPQLLALHKSKISEENFLKSSLASRNRIDEIYSELTDLPFAPYECRDMDEKFQSFAASLHNIHVFYSEKGLSTWDAKSRLQQSSQQVSDARISLQHLEYEMSKVR